MSNNNIRNLLTLDLLGNTITRISLSLEVNYSYVSVKVHIYEHTVKNEITNKISFENVLNHFSNLHPFICDFPNGIVHFKKQTFLKGCSILDSRKFGYVRVSAKDQNENRQVESMKEIGIGDRDIFIDKQSGKNFDRENYQLMKRMMRKGDTLYIHSLDRFGRNKEYILNEWRKLNKEIGIDIVVLDMPLLDTTKHKDSIETFISDLILQVLSWIAKDERERIRKRQREGIDLALANGVKFGRPSIQITDEFIQAYEKWKTGKITAVRAMDEAGMKKSSFYKMVKEYEASFPLPSR